jgi:hypothetical protein
VSCRASFLKETGLFERQRHFRPFGVGLYELARIQETGVKHPEFSQGDAPWIYLDTVNEGVPGHVSKNDPSGRAKSERGWPATLALC